MNAALPAPIRPHRVFALPFSLFPLLLLLPGGVWGQVSGDLPGGVTGQVSGDLPGGVTGQVPAAFPGGASGQVPPALPDSASAEGVVRELYDLVTFPAGTTPDWERARSLFLPQAVVVLRTSRTETTVFGVEGWIQDFVTFIREANVEAAGFSETVVRTHATIFGEIAHVWVLYEAQIPGRGRPPQQGVDSFQLVRREGRWRIASILNEIPTPDRPVPEVLRGEGPGR